MLKSFMRYMMIERLAAKKTCAAWGELLDKNGDAFTQKLSKLSGSDDNRKMLSHIIGIEKWGQRRIKVAFGEPFKNDEYDAYRPVANRSWQMLKAEFRATRRSTVALAERLDTGEADHSKLIKHNQYGDLTLAGWLRYLDMHSKREGKRLK
ncbi:MAG: DinB family protein [Chloroflexi bacterium]|nr:DinB family protein [Chloroflexota bacterium]